MPTTLHPYLGLWSVLLPWVSPYRRTIAFAVLAIVAIATALLSLGLGIAALIDRGLTDHQALTTIIGFCVCAAVLLAVGSYARTILVNQLAERVIADMRLAMFRQLLALPPAWFETHPRGDIIARFTSDAVMIQTVLASQVSMAVRNLLVLAGGLVMLSLTSPTLTLLIVLMLPIVVIPVVLVARRLRHHSRQAQTSQAHLTIALDESLAAIDDIVIFGRSTYIASRFAQACQASYAAAKSQIHTRALLSALVIFLAIATIALLFWFGGQGLIAGDLTGGALSAFVFYSALVVTALAALSDLGGELGRAAAATHRMHALLTESPPPPPKATTPFPMLADATDTPVIALHRVRFSYPSRPHISAVGEVSFTVALGERVALVGASGAGKTTLLKLVLGLIAADAGEIRIGGVALGDLDRDALRHHIAVVPQHASLFSASIKDNIGFADPSKPMSEIETAAKRAGMHEFIAGLPHGYQTLIGEKGVQLSGGQRAQVAIARALLRDAPILLLDEATASLDSATEAKVRKGLETLLAARTSLVIAHRLASVVDATRIVVLDRGRVVAVGQHKTLLRESEIYRNLASLQLLA